MLCCERIAETNSAPKNKSQSESEKQKQKKSKKKPQSQNEQKDLRRKHTSLSSVINDSDCEKQMLHKKRIQLAILRDDHSLPRPLKQTTVNVTTP